MTTIKHAQEILGKLQDKEANYRRRIAEHGLEYALSKEDFAETAEYMRALKEDEQQIMDKEPLGMDEARTMREVLSRMHEQEELVSDRMERAAKHGLGKGEPIRPDLDTLLASAEERQAAHAGLEQGQAEKIQSMQEDLGR